MSNDFNNTVPSDPQLYAFETFFTAMYLTMDPKMLLGIIETFSDDRGRSFTIREQAYRRLQLRVARSVARGRNII